MGTFDGKTVMITGGTSGIGSAAAVLFAKEGANVAVLGRDADRGNAVVGEVEAAGAKGIFLKADVASASDVEEAVEETVGSFGRLDCAFNNAGILHPITPIVDETEDEWDRMIDINLKGVWLCLKYQIKQMLKQGGGGSIVNNSSVAGIRASRTSSSYGASKYGVVGLTKTAALQYGGDNIRVNCVCPALIETPMFLYRDDRTDLNDQWVSELPLGRMGKPEEAAEAAVFLCSDKASFITGAVLTADGGQFT